MLHTEITRFLGKKTAGLTFFLAAATFINAQEKQSISGRITNENGAGVPYASVEFNHKSNKALNDAALTDENGNFKLNLANGNYVITIEAINFQKKTLSKEINGNSNLGNISLSAAPASSNKEKQIEAVVITAKSSQPYKLELDKKIYNVDQDLIAKGGSLQDVLSNAPSVSVDADGSVSMRGSSDVKFLINGKPSSILGITDDTSNILKSIPADQIERIEIITNPSSKYEAEGTAGILNIILKKTNALGFNGSVNGSLGYTPSSRLNTNLSWNYGKWTWFVNGGGGISKTKSESSSNIFYKNTGERLDLINTNKPEFKNYNFSSGFTFSPTDKTSINASFTANSMSMEPISSQQNISNITGTTFRNSTGKDKNRSIQVDAGLEHKFNQNGHLISLSGSYQNTINDSYSDISDNRNITRTLYQYKNTSDFSQITWLGKLDYELPIGENSRFEAGARYDYRDNDINTYYAGSSGGAFTTFNDVTGKNNYTEKNAAFYAQFKSKINKFGYQLGLRNENIFINIQTNNTGGQTSKSKNYSEFFPSVFLSYDITSKSQFSLNYSRRIKRPKHFEIIPVIRMQNDPNRFMGNADLNPSFVNSFEFSYNYTRAKWNISPTLYYQRKTDNIEMVTEEMAYINPLNGLASTYILSTPYNLGTEDRYGLDLNYSISPTNWLRLFGNVNFYRYKSESTYNNNTIINEGNSLKARLTTNFRLDKTINLQIQGHFKGGHKDYTTRKENSYSLNAAINKNLWKNTATIGLSIQDIFNSRKFKSYTDSDTFTRYAEMQMMPRQIMLTFSYRFKNENAKEQKPQKQLQKEQNDEDSSEMVF